jgi:hypothetical protein
VVVPLAGAVELGLGEGGGVREGEAGCEGGAEGDPEGGGEGDAAADAPLPRAGEGVTLGDARDPTVVALPCAEGGGEAVADAVFAGEPLPLVAAVREAAPVGEGVPLRLAPPPPPLAEALALAQGTAVRVAAAGEGECEAAAGEGEALSDAGRAEAVPAGAPAVADAEMAMAEAEALAGTLGEPVPPLDVGVGTPGEALPEGEPLSDSTPLPLLEPLAVCEDEPLGAAPVALGEAEGGALPLGVAHSDAVGVGEGDLRGEVLSLGVADELPDATALPVAASDGCGVRLTRADAVPLAEPEAERLPLPVAHAEAVPRAGEVLPQWEKGGEALAVGGAPVGLPLLLPEGGSERVAGAEGDCGGVGDALAAAGVPVGSAPVAVASTVRELVPLALAVALPSPLREEQPLLVAQGVAVPRAALTEAEDEPPVVAVPPPAT